MPVSFDELSGLSVTLDQLVPQPQADISPSGSHPFVYFLSIHNKSDQTVTFVGRKWIVTDSHGEILVVEGDGIVGQMPCLEPGQTFSYNSFHGIRSTSTAKGTFFGSTQSGRPVYVRVPEFRMELDA